MNMLIGSSVFHSCFSSGHGGGIYFNCAAGSSVLYNVCGYNCYSTLTSVSDGQLARMSTGTTSKNFLHYVSVRSCPLSEGSNRYNPVSILQGYQQVNNNNFTKNKCVRISSFQSVSSNTFNSVYCTIVGNSVTDGQILNCHSGVSRVLQYSNFINNTSPNAGVIFIWESAALTIEFSVFSGNSNILFYVGSGSLTVRHSFIKHTSTLKSGSLVTSNITALTSTYLIHHYATNMCETPYYPTSTYVKTAGKPDLRIGTIVLLYLIFYII